MRVVPYILYYFNISMWYGGCFDTQNSKPVPIEVYRHNNRVLPVWGPELRWCTSIQWMVVHFGYVFIISISAEKRKFINFLQILWYHYLLFYENNPSNCPVWSGETNHIFLLLMFLVLISYLIGLPSLVHNSIVHPICTQRCSFFFIFFQILQDSLFPCELYLFQTPSLLKCGPCLVSE